MSRQTVSIEKLVFGGMGLARTDRGIIFVNDVVPDETVEIELCGKKGGVTVARPVKVLEPSPARRTPPCSLYGKCGGCDWLHIEYKTQVDCKKEMLVDCMRRIGRIENLPPVEVIIADEFGYRHRAQIKIDKNGNAGFYSRHTNTVVPVRRCPLLVDPLNKLLNGIADRNISIPRSLKSIMVVAGDNGSIASYPVITGQTSANVMITAGNRTFEVPGHDFFQSNRPLLERLGAWAGNYVSGDSCVDLYGGGGFFSVMLADQFKHGLLIESIGTQVASALRNFAKNDVRHFTARKGVAENLLQFAGAKPVDCLIVDPPRSGLTEKVRHAVAALKPRTILYVSCNPSTQARDVGFLITKAGYVITHAAIFDLYPNTHHIESLLILEKK
ncbi:MAG: hypothetical protein ABSF80_04820 [Chitinispirillaceae bacterium]